MLTRRIVLQAMLGVTGGVLIDSLAQAAPRKPPKTMRYYGYGYKAGGY